MSRIGNKIIPVPSGVKIQIKDSAVEVQGPKGKMQIAVPRGIHFEQKDGTLTAKRDSDEQRALHGLARALVANAVTGVTTGFKKDLDIVGVGYRAEVKGKNVVLALGYSHPSNSRFPRASRSLSKSRRTWWYPARTKIKWARSRRICAVCVRLTPTSRRACALPASG